MRPRPPALRSNVVNNTRHRSGSVLSWVGYQEDDEGGTPALARAGVVVPPAEADPSVAHRCCMESPFR